MHDVYRSRNRTGRNIHHLNIFPVDESSNDQSLPIAGHLRIRRPGVLDNVFRLTRRNTVLVEVINVPVGPNELHHD